MKRASVYVLVAAAALLWVGLARAERESEYAGGADAVPKPKPKQPARAGFFAEASIANVKPTSPEQRDERRFLKEASAASRFESEASRMAISRSNDPEVRSFAAALAEHHASTGIALQHLLHGRGMAPPMLANDQRKILNRLAKLRGAKFDREYMEEVGLKYQQVDVQAYERAGLVIRDPVLKGWIDTTLPAMRDHLAAAERITAKPGTSLTRGTGRALPVQPARDAAAQPRKGDLPPRGNWPRT